MNLDAFNKRLDEVFRGRLRLRWSSFSRSYHVEQRVGRGVFDPPTRRDHPESDRRQRARDGYAHVMQVMEGDRMGCPICHQRLDVPVMEIAEVRCEYCARKGRDVSFFASYFPIGESLIDHLRKIDPENDGVRRQAAEVARTELAREKSLERAADGELHDGLLDAAIDQIPKWGYGGVRRFEG